MQSFGLSTIANGFEKSTVTDELNRPHAVHSDGLGRTIRGGVLPPLPFAHPEKEWPSERALRKAKEPAARGWVSQAARAARAAGEFGRPSIQVSDPIINSAVA